MNKITKLKFPLYQRDIPMKTKICLVLKSGIVTDAVSGLSENHLLSLWNSPFNRTFVFFTELGDQILIKKRSVATLTISKIEGD
jgi:hypothetical protein